MYAVLGIGLRYAVSGTRYPICGVRYAISEMRSPICGIYCVWKAVSGMRCSVCGVRDAVSGVRSLICVILCPICGLRYAVVCGARYAVSGVRSPVCGILCSLCSVRYAVWCMWYSVCGFQCAFSGMRYTMCGILCPVCGFQYIRCPICGVRYVVSGVRFPVCSIRHAVSSMQRPACGLWYAVSCMWCLVCGFRYAVYCMRSPICNFRYAISAMRSPIRGLRYAVSDMRTPVCDPLLYAISGMWPPLFSPISALINVSGIIRFWNIGLRVYHQETRRSPNVAAIFRQCLVFAGNNGPSSICHTLYTPFSFTSTLTTLKYFCINHGDQSFFQFEIIINVLVGSFRFIWIAIMSWVYGRRFFWIPTSRDDPRTESVNPLTAKLFNLNFHPLEVVDRVTQVSENYSDLTKWRQTLFKSCWLMSHFILNIFKLWYLMC